MSAGFTKPKIALLLFATLLPLSGLPLSGVALDRPNIVLILADDIGYSDFGAFGGEIDTPHIDALAAAGMRFTNFHTASSCAPTRAMLMTGVDNHLAGIGSMRELMPLSHRGKPGYRGVLNDRVRTIAELMQAVGYHTSVAGKWHLGTEEENLPPARGFDYSVVQADSGSDNYEMRPYLPMTPEARWYENGQRMKELPADFYSSTYFVDRTIAYLDTKKGSKQPFFAYVAFQANHTPIQAPSKFIDPYRGRYLEGWAEVRQERINRIKTMGLLAPDAKLASGPTQEAWEALTPKQQYFEARRMQAYAGMATAMDHEIGRLIDWLKASGMYENTVFVVFSDNGAVANEPYDNPSGRKWLESNYHREVEQLGAQGSWISSGRQWGQVANTPFSGQKFSASEGGMRVPLIIAGTPGTEPGAIHREFTYVTDIAPTLLDLAGWTPQDAPADTQQLAGNSLAPLLGHGSASWEPKARAVGYEFSGNAALFRNEHKLLRNLPPAGDGAWRLYNITLDPGETTDISAIEPDLFRQMQAEYAAYEGNAGVLPMPDDYSLNEQVAINTLLFFYLPRYLPYLAGLILLIAVAAYYVRRRSSLR